MGCLTRALALKIIGNLSLERELSAGIGKRAGQQQLLCEKEGTQPENEDVQISSLRRREDNNTTGATTAMGGGGVKTREKDEHLRSLLWCMLGPSFFFPPDPFCWPVR